MRIENLLGLITVPTEAKNQRHVTERAADPVVNREILLLSRGYPKYTLVLEGSNWPVLDK